MSDSEMRFLIGMGFVGLGYGSSAGTEDADSSIFPYTKKAVLFKIKKNGFYHSLGIRLRV